MPHRLTYEQLQSSNVKGTTRALALPNSENDGRDTGKVRFNVFHDGAIIASCAIEAKENGVLRFWLPKLLTTNPATDLLLDLFDGFLKVVEDRFYADDQLKILETKPGEDLPYWDIWVQCLKTQSYSLVAQGHIYISQGATAAIKQGTNKKTIAHISPFDISKSKELAALVNDVYSNSLSRHELLDWKSGESHIEELLALPIREEASSLAYVGSHLIGYVLSGIESDDTQGKNEAWIYGIGVNSSYRNKKIGGALLAYALSRLFTIPNTDVYGFIDDENTPSIKLFSKFGFIKSVESHFVYRKPKS